MAMLTPVLPAAYVESSAIAVRARFESGSGLCSWPCRVRHVRAHPRLRGRSTRSRSEGSLDHGVHPRMEPRSAGAAARNSTRTRDACVRHEQRSFDVDVDQDTKGQQSAERRVLDRLYVAWTSVVRTGDRPLASGRRETVGRPLPASRPPQSNAVVDSVGRLVLLPLRG